MPSMLKIGLKVPFLSFFSSFVNSNGINISVMRVHPSSEIRLWLKDKLRKVRLDRSIFAIPKHDWWEQMNNSEIDWRTNGQRIVHCRNVLLFKKRTMISWRVTYPLLCLDLAHADHVTTA
jgi:hypothetical protein